MRLFRGLQNAFETSNKFREVIRRIKWDSAKFSGDEWVFRLGKLTFTTPSLDQNECRNMWSPAVQLADGEWMFLFA